MPQVSGDVLFREEQRFGAWLWAVPAAIAGVLTWGILHFGFGCPSGGRPPELIVLAVGLAVPVLLALMMGFARLTVEVGPETIRVRFFPFSAREIPARDVVACDVRRYRPLVEYGGWGVRYGFRHGWAYNVRGNLGVQLRLREGRPLLIGSQRADELARAIRSILA